MLGGYFTHARQRTCDRTDELPSILRKRKQPTPSPAHNKSLPALQTWQSSPPPSPPPSPPLSSTSDSDIDDMLSGLAPFLGDPDDWALDLGDIPTDTEAWEGSARLLCTEVYDWVSVDAEAKALCGGRSKHMRGAKRRHVQVPLVRMAKSAPETCKCCMMATWREVERTMEHLLCDGKSKPTATKYRRAVRGAFAIVRDRVTVA
jgi:hypothetical protein